MLEQVSNYFFDPLVFWGLPLVLVALLAGIKRLRAWASRRRSRGRISKTGDRY
jgi:hypothetical protein